MTDTKHFQFPCPSCGELLSFPIGGVGAKTECPHCYAIVTTPHQGSDAEGKSPESAVVGDSPFDGPRQTGGFLSFVCFFFSILTPFFCFVFALVSCVVAFYPNSESALVTGEQIGNTVLHIIQAAVFLLWGAQSFRAGYRLWRMQPLAVHKARTLVYLSAAYGIIELAILSLFMNAHAGPPMPLGAAVLAFVFAVAWLLTTLLLLLLYLHNSRRIRVTFPDEFSSVKSG